MCSNAPLVLRGYMQQHNQSYTTCLQQIYTPTHNNNTAFIRHATHPLANLILAI